MRCGKDASSWKDECTMMHAQESLQHAHGDTFFGVDKDDADRRRRMAEMKLEDDASTFREECDRLNNLHARWTSANEGDARTRRARRDEEKEQDRVDYMNSFLGARSSDLAVAYQWPSQSPLAPGSLSPRSPPLSIIGGASIGA